MEYSEQLAQVLVAHMEEQGYRYDFDREQGMLKTGFGIRGKLKRVRIYVDIRKNGYSLYACIGVNADEDTRMEVAKFLTMVNYGLYMGNFELDFRDGEIRYKYALDCEADTLTPEQIERSLDIPIMMFTRYGDDLLKVIFGFETAEQAIENTEGDSSGDGLVS